MDKNQLKAVVQKAIAGHGVKTMTADICSVFQKMVRATKAKKRLGCTMLIAHGYENIDPDGLRFVVEKVLEVMSDSPEKEDLRGDYLFWVAHEEEIISDHGLRRVR